MSIRGGYSVGVERLVRSDRAFSLAATMAHEFNNELTIVLNGLAETLLELETGHLARSGLAESRKAAERCASRCSAVLTLAESHGTRALRLPLSSLLMLMQPHASAGSRSPALL